jgi:hypothetical protein
MRILKAFLIYNLTVIVILVGMFLFARPYLAERLKTFIVHKYVDQDLGELEIEKLKIVSLYPVKIEAQKVKGTYRTQNIEFSADQLVAEITIRIFGFKSIESINIQLAMKNRIVKIRPAPQAAATLAQQSQQSAPAAEVKIATDIHIELISENGTIHLYQRAANLGQPLQEVLKVKNEMLRVAISRANQPDKKIEFDFDAQIELPQQRLGREIPVRIRAKDLQLNNNKLESTDVVLSLAGIALNATGESDLITGAHNWHAKAEITNIEKLPVLPQFLPAGQWSGGLLADVQLNQLPPNPILVQGLLVSRNLEANLKVSQDLVSIEGPVSPVFEIAFQYTGSIPESKNKGILSVSKAKIDLDLTQAHLEIKNYVSKPKDTKLHLFALGDGDMNTFRLQEFQMQFAQFKLLSQATIDMSQPLNSQVNLQMAQTPLSGLEKLILPLKDLPTKGTLEMAAQMKSGTIDILKMNLQSNLGQLRLSGRVQNMNTPKLNLAFDVANLKVREALRFAPEYTNTKADGSANAQFKLSGEYLSEKGISESPLSVKGAVSVNLSQFVVPPTTQPAPTPQASRKNSANSSWEDFQKQMALLPESKPLLPNWPLLKSSEVSLSLNLKNLIYDQSRFENLSVNGVYNKGVLRGRAAVQKAFQGQVVVNDFATSNLFEPPRISLQVDAKKLSAIDIAKQFAPEALSYIRSGFVSNRAKATIPMPGTKNWLLEVVATGEANGHQIQTPENAIEKVIGEKLSAIAKKQKLISQSGRPLVADVYMKYALSAGEANVARFHMLTTDQHEFEGQGRAWANLQAQIKGQLHLSHLDVPSSLRKANSDAKGRLVVPVTYMGSILNPGFEVAASTLETMTKNTLKYEAQNLKDSLRDKLKDKKNQEKLKNAVKGLFQ